MKTKMLPLTIGSATDASFKSHYRRVYADFDVDVDGGNITPIHAHYTVEYPIEFGMGRL